MTELWRVSVHHPSTPPLQEKRCRCVCMVRLIVPGCDLRSIQPLIALLKCHIEKQARVKSLFFSCAQHIFTNSHIDSLSFPHSLACTPLHTPHTRPHGEWCLHKCPLFPPPSPPFSHSLSLSLPWLVFRHAGSSTLGCTRSPPALPLPPSSSLYISPVRHLHGNVERDLCPWRAVWRSGVFRVGGGGVGCSGRGAEDKEGREGSGGTQYAHPGRPGHR